MSVFLTMEQRVNIKCCVNLGKTPTETYEMLQTVCDDEASSLSSVSELFNRLEYLQDGPNSGRPSTSRNAATVASIREMVT
jgi:hypothetical protein